jgi:hypothetical protein
VEKALPLLMRNDVFRFEYEKVKLQLFKKENWKSVGVFGEASFTWTKNSSGRFRMQRVGFPDFDEANNMDKSRIASVVSQANQEVSGFDFNASFNEMEQTLRDMRRLTVQHETLSGQATKVTESLCAVAESLTLDANSGAV